MQINKQAVYSFTIVFILGVATVITSIKYDLGTLDSLGPGAVPFGIGCLLLLLSPFVLFDQDSSKKTAVEEAPSKTKGQHRGWLFVTAGAILFIVLGRYGGLIPATLGTVFIAALGDRHNSILSALTLAIGVCIFSVLVFHYLLRMPIPLITWG